MAYIRAKTRTGERGEASTYYYVVQSSRAGGKVKQTTIAYLGPYDTVQDALAHTLARLEGIRRDMPQWQKRHAELADQRDQAGPQWRRRTWGGHTEYRVLSAALEAAPDEVARLEERLRGLHAAAAALGIGVSQVTPANVWVYRRGDDARRFAPADVVIRPGFLSDLAARAAALTHVRDVVA